MNAFYAPALALILIAAVAVLIYAAAVLHGMALDSKEWDGEE